MWTDQESRLIQFRELFEKKPGIMKKAEEQLDRLRQALIDEIRQHPRPFPEATDVTKGQIARGENHKGFPFISLDLPQRFTKTEFFTFRTLFWWGHYLGFSLILKGPALDDYRSSITEGVSQNRGVDLMISKDPNPWEWEISESNFLPLQHANPEFLKATVETNQYIKLIRVYPVQEARFQNLEWVDAGLSAYRDILNLVLPET